MFFFFFCNFYFKYVMKSLKLVNLKKKLEVRFLKKIEKKKCKNFVKKFPNAHTSDLVIFF